MGKTLVFENGGSGCGAGIGELGTLAALGANGGMGGANSMWPMMAMMNGGMNGQWNNPFVYLVWMMFAQRFFGNGCGDGNGNGQTTTNAQLEALREQMNTNQNSNLLMDAIKGNNTAIGQLASQLNCDFNTLNSAICDVRGGIDRVAGQVGFSAERVINAVQMGDSNIISNLNQCCCTLRDAITQQGYQNQLAIQGQTNVLQNGQRDLGVAITKGFCDTAYGFREQTCALTNTINEGINKVLAGQRDAEFRELQRDNQALRDERTQYQMSALLQQQSRNIIDTVRPCPTPAFITCNPWGCNGGFYGNGYGYNGYNNGGYGCNNGCGCNG